MPPEGVLHSVDPSCRRPRRGWFPVPRPLVLMALVWAPFLSLFLFASLGDRSHPHLAFHVFALALLVPAALLATRSFMTASTRAQRVLTGVLVVTVPLSVVGHVLELAVAVARFASDGWVDRDTSDIWVTGPHVWAANVTVPSMLLSMLTTVVLVVVTRVQGRRRQAVLS